MGGGKNDMMGKAQTALKTPTVSSSDKKKIRRGREYDPVFSLLCKHP